jgi:hypothetical protein
MSARDAQLPEPPVDAGLVRWPQPWFILPTLRFWSSENTRRIRVFIVPPIAVAATAWFMVVARASWLPGPLRVLLAGAGGGVIAYLTLGIAERLLRIAVARRRKKWQLETTDGERALPGSSS